MVKRQSLSLATAAALAFAAPAMASAAAPTLEFAKGGVVPTGSGVVATGANVSLTSSTLGEIKCEKLNLKATVSKNNATEGVQAKGAEKGEEPSQTNCKNGSNSVKITNVTVSNIASSSNGIATASATLLVDIGASTKCTYTGVNLVATYTNGGTTIQFTSAEKLTGSPALCGTAKLDGIFSLEDNSGNALKWVFH